MSHKTAQSFSYQNLARVLLYILIYRELEQVAEK